MNRLSVAGVWGLGAILAVATAGGCIGSQSKACGDIVCPKGFECDESHELCIRKEQRDSCRGLPDGTQCQVGGRDGFHCDREICIPGDCGDGIFDATEECDDGDANSDITPDACRTNCRLPRCGDGIVDASNGEACDDGADNSDQERDACRTNCAPPSCGDAVIDASELCDDGNQVSGDGCSGDCRSDERCGNGIVDPQRAETCDCGDGTGPLPSGCTAPNGAAGSPCTSGCLGVFCGNGEVDPGEECDGTPGCGPTCLTERCGNGFVDPGETCDDGNQVGGDGCGATCVAEFCGNGIIDTALGEDCDDGNGTPGDGCGPSCLVERCGNGFVDGATGETCDDGNTRSGDGCSSCCDIESLGWVDRTPVGPLALTEHAMAYDVARGRLVLFGGEFATGTTLSGGTWEYDGNGWVEMTPATSPQARAGHAMAFDGDRSRIVLFGGRGSGGTGRLGDTWEYDGGRWVETTPTVSPDARFEHALAYDGARARVVLFGGENDQGVTRGDTWEYDGAAWVQMSPPAAPVARSSHALAFDRVRARVVLFGGSDDGGADLDDTWEYDGATWSRMTSSATPAARTGHALTYDAVRSRVVLFGGGAGSAGIGSDTWEYDGTTWSQVFPSVPPATRRGHALAFDESGGRAILVGGENFFVFFDTYAYDGSAWVPVSIAPKPPARYDAAAAYDRGRGRVVLFGGWGDTNRLADTWEHDGFTWHAASPTASPAARSGHAMAYDAQRDRVVLFGGAVSGAFSDETWEYDGTTWALVAVAATPLARERSGMVYDASRGRIVLFGGFTEDFLDPESDETWVYDGTAWAQLFPANRPPARYGHGMAYDAARDRVVVVNGQRLPLSGDPVDTWEFDGADWAQVPPVAGAPQPSGRGVLAYDALRGRTVFYGFPGSTDTWFFDGVTWTESTLVDIPPTRSAHTLVYDAARAWILMFGGDPLGSGDTSDETWTLQVSSRCPAELCLDGVDVDGDGQAGCADPDCAVHPNCLP